MNDLIKHEIFEIEVLEILNTAKLLDSLVFGGGTMLRLCHELNRYSADLDFWFVKTIDHEKYFKKIKDFLNKKYELTDAHIKHFTLLFEIRSKNYPKRLKIEIRKAVTPCNYQEKIAFSKYATSQVVLRAHTLEQTMRNKIDAALNRKEIRDCYDIEFLLRRGISLAGSGDKLAKLREIATAFKPKDYSVTLGAILEPEMRKYYKENKFKYLLEKIMIF